ncbi:hypothetical protein ScPMuIL_011120 [Solemya velum]
MATGTDQAVGWGLVSFAGFVFTYYTIWVILLPFVDEGQSIHKFFPPRFYAIAAPLIAGVIGLILIAVFVAVILSASQKKKKS